MSEKCLFLYSQTTNTQWCSTHDRALMRCEVANLVDGNGRLKSENERLKAENERLRVHSERQNGENEYLMKLLLKWNEFWMQTLEHSAQVVEESSTLTHATLSRLDGVEYVSPSSTSAGAGAEGTPTVHEAAPGDTGARMPGNGVQEEAKSAPPKAEVGDVPCCEHGSHFPHKYLEFFPGVLRINERVIFCPGPKPKSGEG